MIPQVKKALSAFWKPVRKLLGKVTNEDVDPMQWSRDLEKHFAGEFSFAVVQGNTLLEDHSQVETGSHALFVGIYDGHGGSEVAQFVRDNLFLRVINLAAETGAMSGDIIRSAFASIEAAFISDVRKEFAATPKIAAIGSCCLVGIIWEGTLYVANLGDSRAVIGHEAENNIFVAEQFSEEHNARHFSVRRELETLHPTDSQIVVQIGPTWRVKGIIQVSRSIGDAYLKYPEFSLDDIYARFRLSTPLTRPVLLAEPTLLSRALRPDDKFLIFASDGLWDLMTNEEAVDFVSKNPRSGIAKRLLKLALKKAATQKKTTYKKIKKTESTKRREIHDDITVIVVFIDHGLLKKNASVPELSIRGFVDAVVPSQFSILNENIAEGDLVS